MALRDDDKVMAGLLRRTLASSPKPGVAPSAGGASGSRGDDCPPADLLAAYYEHSLDADESSRYELHFSQCALCREQLAAMARAEEVPQPRASWAWIWNPYWLAPALAVLTLAIFFGVHHPSRTSTTAVTSAPANAPLVAMSRPDQASPQEPAAPPPPPPAAARNAPSNEVQKALSDSVERDSLTKEKQSQLRESPAPANAPLAYSAPSPLPASPTPSDKKAQDLPLNGRNSTELQPLVKSETAQKDTGAPQSSAQSAEITAEEAPHVQTSAERRGPDKNRRAPSFGYCGSGSIRRSRRSTRQDHRRNRRQKPDPIIWSNEPPRRRREISGPTSAGRDFREESIPDAKHKCTLEISGRRIRRTLSGRRRHMGRAATTGLRR